MTPTASTKRSPIKLSELFDALKREMEGKALGYISDIYLQQGKPPVFYCCGEFTFPNPEFFSEFEDVSLTKDDLGSMINECMTRNEEKLGKVDRQDLRDFAFTWKFEGFDGEERIWRIRAHVSSNYSGQSICFRLLDSTIPDLTELDIPPVLGELAVNNPTGLIIVSGGTGSGKSTTVASIIKAYSEQRKGHIATLEDPVEYILDFPQTLITQHWVGHHFATWAEGIKAALRDKVELLMIGELRDQESVRAAIHAASSGHIVIATAHFTSSVKVLSYLESMFPTDERSTVRASLAETLLAVCCQKLLPSEEYGFAKPIPCYELLLNNQTMANNLKNDVSAVLSNLLEQTPGCISWDSRLDELHRNRLIDERVYNLNTRKETKK